MAFEVEALPGVTSFGVMVRGLTFADLDKVGIRTYLRDLWIDKGVIVFRDTEGTPQFQVALSRIFGELELHPLIEARVPELPELVSVRYHPDNGDIYDVGGEVRGGYIPWHSDLVYVDKINRGGILRPVTLPRAGGDTGFLDQISMYDALPAQLRSQVDGLEILYWQEFNAGNKRYGAKPRTIRLSSICKRIVERVAGSPRVIHPAVYVQAETGRKVLNVSPAFAVGIHGRENAEGDALLEELISFCENPNRAYVHRWQAGDMVLWDNWRMLHSALGVPEGEARHMQRTTIRGDYALGRVERQGQKISDDLRVSI